MDAVVRLATLADVPLLARLHSACFEEHWGEAAIASLLDRAGSFALLAGHDDLLANESQCFIMVQIASSTSEILSLGTRPAMRRLGLARLGLRAAAAEAQLRGAVEMFLEVADDNEAAVALYRGAGFSPAGLRKGYYHREKAAAADAVILRTPLPLGD
jgi:ribosomal-protein-alanine N-acetyltransferase